MTELSPTTQTFGRYTLLKKLAQGGMGEIYLAEFQGIAGFNKRCVIKKILPELAAEASFVEKFLQEGKTLVDLTHSNIVQIFDMGQVGQDYYLAMEYIDGADLRQLLKAKPEPMPIALAIYIAMEVLQGLSYAHRASSQGRPLQLIHRDISSSNLLISTEGELKIIDFGIAKNQHASQQTERGMVQGKFSYMSPEQARGEELDQRSDLFSLGIVFYECLSGRRPFDDASELQILERIKTGSYPELKSLRADIDEELQAIVDKALQGARKARYQTAYAFYEALERYFLNKSLKANARDLSLYFGDYLKQKAENSQQGLALDMAMQQLLIEAEQELSLSINADPARETQGLLWQGPEPQATRTFAPSSQTQTLSPAFTHTRPGQTPSRQASSSAAQTLQGLASSPEQSSKHPNAQPLSSPEDAALLPQKEAPHVLRYIVLGVVLGLFLALWFLFSFQDWDLWSSKQTESVKADAQHERQALSRVLALNAAPSLTQTVNRPSLQSRQDFVSEILSRLAKAATKQGEEVSAENKTGEQKDKPEKSETNNTEQAKAAQAQSSQMQDLNPKAGRPESKASSKPSERKHRTREHSTKWSMQIRANVPATLEFQGKTQELPCQIELEANEPWRVLPQSSSHSLALAYQGSGHEARQVQVQFCELDLRIAESFVDNDPSPYQLADIYIDGKLIARRKARVRLILPCKHKEVEARYSDNKVELSAAAKLQLQTQQSQRLTLRLK